MVNENQYPYTGDDGAAVTDAVEDMPWAPAVLSDKGLFLLLLYDKAISCMDEALVMIEQGDMVGKGDRLIHAQEIVLQLTDALDKSTGDIADNLERLYLYVYRRLIEGNVRLDRNAILEAKGIMRDLYDAWQAIILGQDSSRPGNSWEAHAGTRLSA
ncbi:MAG TPA: flagellar export chaperone FliS [Candidatus Latescibacteria bacterium]|jgi:flagellar protein FliS|nr:flagellar export chaperone FliS [Candidatus Latescibacterota bacterium]HJP32732.1 flagellar export chaperone FliS [Candidatus Latescibacterota bacterium]